MIVYLIYELHNGVERRLKSGYANKKLAYKKVEEWNKWNKGVHEYYVREFEIYEK